MRIMRMYYFEKSDRTKKISTIAFYISKMTIEAKDTTRLNIRLNFTVQHVSPETWSADMSTVTNFVTSI